MFREIARKKQSLEMSQIIKILNSEKRGVLSVHGDNGYPYGLPINYWYNEENGCLYADKNHIEALFELGLMNFRPFETHRKNFQKALQCFTIAANKGNTEAQYMTGYMYEYGHVRVDIDKSIGYYEMAAKQGHTLSSLQLSLLYQQPEHKNYHRAFQHALKATNRGCAEAEYILGNLLFFGRGCEHNIEKAYQHYKNAYEHGIYPAKIMIDEVHKVKNIK